MSLFYPTEYLQPTLECGIKESERENCTTQVKNVMLSTLKINEEIVNSANSVACIV